MISSEFSVDADMTEDETSLNEQKSNEMNNTNSGGKMKLLILVVSLVLVITGIIMGVVFGMKGNDNGADNTDEDKKPPNNNATENIKPPGHNNNNSTEGIKPPGHNSTEGIKPPDDSTEGPLPPEDINLFLQEMYRKSGAESFSNFGKVLSTNDDGSKIAIVGNGNDRLLQIYAINNEENSTKVTDFEKIGVVGKSNSDLQVSDIALSGDGSYLVVSLSDSRFHLYKPSSSGKQKWDLVDAPIFITDPSRSNIPVAISTNGKIITAAVLHSRVEIYQLSSDEKLSQLGSSIELVINDFGNAIALSSDGFRIAIASEELTFLYEYSDGDWNFMNPEPHPAGNVSSVSLNADGDVLCVGQPNFAHGNNITGRCICYSIRNDIDANITSYIDANETHYTTSIIGQPIYGNGHNEHLGSVVELSKDGNILAITSSGTNAVHVFQLSSDQNYWIQIEPTLKEAFNSSISLSMDGSNIFVGSPTGDGINNTFGTTYLYGVQNADTASE